MRRLIAATALLLLLSACTLWKEKRTATWGSATGPATFERLLWQEISAGNWDEVARHLSPTFRASLPAGVVDRDGAIAAWKSLPAAQAVLGEMSVAPQGHVMVVTYTAQFPASERQMMTVWQETPSHGWIAIAHSETPISAGNQLPKM